MVDFLQNMTHYHWLTLGLVLIILEIFGFGGFLLGAAIAAFVVAILNLLVTMPWYVEWLTFGAISIFATFIWYIYQFEVDKKDDEITTLNQKANAFIGKEITVEKDLPKGNGRLRIGDSEWSVYTSKSLKKGDTVEVTKLEGIILHITKK